MAEIKWAYDATEGSFSPLPASPFLLPALGLICLFPIIEKMMDEARKNPRPCNIDKEKYKRYKERFHYLIQKESKHNGLDDNETLELHSLMNPPWADPNELWTY